MRHYLKTWPAYFERIISGKKRFEVRKNDRDFQVGDVVTLVLYDPEKQIEMESYFHVKITYILHGGQFGIEHGYCIFGFNQVSEEELS